MTVVELPHSAVSAAGRRDGSPHGEPVAGRIVAAGPAGLALCVDDPGLLGLTGQVFPRCPAPSTTPWHMRVSRRDEGFLLTRPDGSTLPVAGGEAELVVALEREVVLHARRVRSDELFLHAAGAVGRRGAAVAFGASGSGKSSVALALMCRGLRLVADDMLPVDGEGRVRPFPRHLKVHVDRLAGTGLEPTGTPGHDPTVDEVWVDPTTLPPGFARGPAPVVVAARLAFEAGASPLSVRSMDAPTLLNVALHSRFPEPAGGSGPGTAVDRLLLAFEGVPAYDLTFSDSARAAEFLADAAGGP